MAQTRSISMSFELSPMPIVSRWSIPSREKSSTLAVPLLTRDSVTSPLPSRGRSDR
jgi:hypothetical protein